MTHIKMTESDVIMGENVFSCCKSLLSTLRPELSYHDSLKINILQRIPKDLSYWSPETNPIFKGTKIHSVSAVEIPREILFLVLSYVKLN